VPDLDPPDPLVARPVATPTWRDRIDLLTRPPSLSPSTVGAGVVLLAALALVGWLLLRPPPSPPIETLLPRADGAGAAVTSASPSTSTSVAAELVVHVAGAVARPGVYRVAAGARVADAVDVAGGALADADVHRLNLAAPVVDGERVYVPRVGEVVPLALDGGSSADDPAGPLDLNTATLEQLDALPGVGPATAQAIVDERERRGGFRSVEELLDVRGIGPAKLEQLRDLVTVSSR